MAEFGYFAKKILQNRFKISIFGLIKSLNKMFHFYKIGRFLLNETHVTPNTSYTTNFFSNETHLKYLIYNFLFSQLKSQICHIKFTQPELTLTILCTTYFFLNQN